MYLQMHGELWYIDQSPIHGVGVFSIYRLLPGTRIDRAIEKKMLGVIPSVTPFGSKINHSYNPSAKLIHDPRDGHHYVYSAKTLEAGDEITIDYRHTPPYILGPMPWYK